MSFCSLEEAFPQLAQGSKEPSCWSQTEKMHEPIPVGAQVSKVEENAKHVVPQTQTIPSGQTIVMVPFHQQQQQNGWGGGHKQKNCWSHFQHCMSCPFCYRLMQMHFSLPQNNPAYGAQVQTAPVTTAVTNVTPQKRSVLAEPIFEGSPVTWGTILTLLAGGTMILLLLEISKQEEEEQMARSRSRSYSLSAAERRRRSRRAKASPRKANGQFKRSTGRSRSRSRSTKRKSASRSRSRRSVSRKSRLSPAGRRSLSRHAKNRPRRADGKFKKSRSRSASKKSRKSRSRSRKARFTAAEYREILEVLGMRNTKAARKRLHDLYSDDYLIDVLDGLIVPGKERVAPGRYLPLSSPAAPSPHVMVGGVKEPTAKAVIYEFKMLSPRDVGCNKDEFVRAQDMFQNIRRIPKSSKDLDSVFAIESERQPGRAACWIALFRAYRNVFAELNGRFPSSDVPDNYYAKFGSISLDVD